MTPTHTDFTRGYPIALASAVILATTGIFIRYLTQTYRIPALVLAFWREVFVVLTLLAVLGVFRPARLKARRAHLPYLLVYGLTLAIFNSLWTLSVALNGAAAATVLVYCSAAFTALLGWRLLKERLDRVKLLAVALSLGGCVLAADALNASAWQSNLLGILTGVLSGLGYAAYSLMGRSAAQRGLDPWTTLLYTFGFASLFLLTFNLLPGGALPGAAARPSDLLWLGRRRPAGASCSCWRPDRRCWASGCTTSAWATCPPASPTSSSRWSRSSLRCLPISCSAKGWPGYRSSAGCSSWPGWSSCAFTRDAFPRLAQRQQRDQVERHRPGRNGEEAPAIEPGGQRRAQGAAQ